jgi:transposase
MREATPKIEQLSLAIEEEAWERPEAHRFMTHPGVGPITALAFNSALRLWVTLLLTTE